MATKAPPNDATVIPELEPGDCLSRDEFERRYAAMPECKKAELIEGVVYMPSAVRLQRHGEPHANLIAWMVVYSAATPGLRCADNASDRLDLENEPQPDCMLFIDPRYGGQARISEDDYVEGAPELIAEISTSSVSFDRGPKLRTYRRHGVKEYLIWRVEDHVLDWNVLRDGSYEPLAPNNEGVFCSEVFPGLWLDVDALIQSDMAKVLAILQRGIATDVHQAFVEQLRQRMG